MASDKGKILYGTLTTGSRSLNASMLSGQANTQGEMPGQLIIGSQGPAGPMGPIGPAGKTPVRGVDYWTDSDKKEMVDDVIRILGNNVGTAFETDKTLTLKDGILSVNTTEKMEQDNTLPITSAGVYATVGNIEALLKTI